MPNINMPLVTGDVTDFGVKATENLLEATEILNKATENLKSTAYALIAVLGVYVCWRGFVSVRRELNSSK